MSDWNGEAIRAFDVAFEPLGMSDVAVRSAFLIRDGETVEAAWLLGWRVARHRRGHRRCGRPQRLICMRRFSIRRPYLTANQPTSQ